MKTASWVHGGLARAARRQDDGPGSVFGGRHSAARGHDPAHVAHQSGEVSRGPEALRESLKKHGCDALIAIGGDDTLSVAQKLFTNGVKVVGVPKTIDNDLAGTDFTFGFDTAVNIATEAIDRVHTTAEAHNRVIVVEVMGRSAGWIAAYSGIAGGADVILIPEVPFDIEQVAELIRQRHARGRYFSIVVAAEGAKFSDGNEKHGARPRRTGAMNSGIPG